MSKATFNIFRGNVWFSWELKDANGKLITCNTGYKSRAAALRDIITLKSVAMSADIFDFTKSTSKKNKKDISKLYSAKKKRALHKKA